MTTATAEINSPSTKKRKQPALAALLASVVPPPLIEPVAATAPDEVVDSGNVNEPADPDLQKLRNEMISRKTPKLLRDPVIEQLYAYLVHDRVWAATTSGTKSFWPEELRKDVKLNQAHNWTALARVLADKLTEPKDTYTIPVWDSLMMLLAAAKEQGKSKQIEMELKAAAAQCAHDDDRNLLEALAKTAKQSCSQFMHLKMSMADSTELTPLFTITSVAHKPLEFYQAHNATPSPKPAKKPNVCTNCPKCYEKI